MVYSEAVAVSRIGVLTGGGDAPGLNAVIRAVVKAAFNSGIEVVGLEDSFDGLLDLSRTRVLTPKDVTGILRLGGTILGTTNRGNPFEYPVAAGGGHADYSERVVETFAKMELDALVVIGGDGTLQIAHQFYLMGIPVVGVPKTIDNDIWGTTSCFGFDTAVSFAADAIDRLHTTAEAHRRIMVVEVMGRYAGWIALHAGVAGGADVILIPEISYDLDKVVERLRERESFGARFSIVVVAEGAKPLGGAVTLARAGARRPRRAARRRRRRGRDAAAGEDRQGNALRRARPSAARRRADGVRSRAGDALRRQGRRAAHARRVRPDGRQQPARHRADPAGRRRREDQDRSARLRPAARPRARSGSRSATEG